MSTFLGVIVGIVGLGFLILVHELGHFIVAKATGMRVEEFSLGFGPYIVSHRWGETVYGISWVPLGGYVRVTGMHKEEFAQRVADAREKEADEAARTESAEGGATGQTAESADSRGSGKRKKRRAQDPEDRLAGKRALSAEEIASTPAERRYYSHPLWHKLLFIVAGVVMNAIVAYALLYAVGVAQGEDLEKPVVGSVSAESGAAEAGIRPGDVITSIGGRQVETFSDVRWEILKHKNESVIVELYRDGDLKTVEAEIREDEDGLALLGITSADLWEPRPIGLAEGFAFAGRETANTVVMIFEGIGMMFSGDVPATGSQGLAGPIGIVDISAHVFQGGFGYYVWFLALISINLALLNLLPLLPLDGGHVVLSIVERVRGRSVSLRVFERISTVGLALFALLFFVAMYNDIFRLFTGF